MAAFIHLTAALLSRQFEVSNYDRRKWYTIEYQSIEKGAETLDGELLPPSMGAETPSLNYRDYTISACGRR